MRLPNFFQFTILAIAIPILFSCNKKDEFTISPTDEYLPLVKGKYISYRLDSMVFTSFGTVTSINRYQEKQVIDSAFLDNLGKMAYRVFVFQRDSVGLTAWVPKGTRTITPQNDQVEVLDENNFRTIKLHLPIRDGFNWKGNKYMVNGPYKAYNFSNDDNIVDWDYYYDGEPNAFSYNGKNYTDVISVEQIDESFNVPVTIPTAYAAKSRVVEKYAKGIGLVFSQNELWEYQPNPGGTPYRTGFGVTKWMIDHN